MTTLKVHQLQCREEGAGQQNVSVEEGLFTIELSILHLNHLNGLGGEVISRMMTAGWSLGIGVPPLPLSHLPKVIRLLFICILSIWNGPTLPSQSMGEKGGLTFGSMCACGV